MAEFEKIVQEWLRQASLQKSQGGVLTPLISLAVVTISGLVILGLGHPPTWLAILMSVLAILLVASVIAGFIYFAMRNPDALRTERYLLTKTALDKTRTLSGDNLQGVIATISETLPATPTPALPKTAQPLGSNEGPNS